MDTHIFDFLTTRNKERQLMIESWAEGVETIVTNGRYLGLDGNYFNENNNFLGWNFNRQEDQVVQMNEYTPLVIDLVDDLNQNGEDILLPIDRVSNYTLQQIQTALNNSHSLIEWEQKLHWNFDNPTENNLQELFDYVYEVYENL